MIEIGGKCDDLGIQFEIGWIIVNAVSGDFEETEELLRVGVFEVLEKQITGEDEKLREQVLEKTMYYYYFCNVISLYIWFVHIFITL